MLAMLHAVLISPQVCTGDTYDVGLLGLAAGLDSHTISSIVTQCYLHWKYVGFPLPSSVRLDEGPLAVSSRQHWTSTSGDRMLTHIICV